MTNSEPTECFMCEEYKELGLSSKCPYHDICPPGEAKTNDAPTKPQEYKSIREIPTQELASRVVQSLILTKGNINEWQKVIGGLITLMREEYEPPAAKLLGDDDA